MSHRTIYGPDGLDGLDWTGPDGLDQTDWTGWTGQWRTNQTEEKTNQKAGHIRHN